MWVQMGLFYLRRASRILKVHLFGPNSCMAYTWLQCNENAHGHPLTHTHVFWNALACTHTAFYVELAPTCDVFLFLAGPPFSLPEPHEVFSIYNLVPQPNIDFSIWLLSNFHKTSNYYLNNYFKDVTRPSRPPRSWNWLCKKIIAMKI